MNPSSIVSTKMRRVSPRLPVARLQRTMDFYTQVLGFRIRCLWPNEKPTFLMLDRDDVGLSFDEVGTTPTWQAASGGGFYVEADDVRAMHEALRGRVPIEWGPEVYPYGCRQFAIRDPDGYVIIFTEETDDPPTCPDE